MILVIAHSNWAALHTMRFLGYQDDKWRVVTSPDQLHGVHSPQVYTIGSASPSLEIIQMIVARAGSLQHISTLTRGAVKHAEIN